MTKTDDVTPAILLDHMRGMEHRLVGRIDGLEKEVKGVKFWMRGVEKWGQRMERKFDFMRLGINNIDDRLDRVEIEQKSRKHTTYKNMSSCPDDVGIS